VSIANRSTVAFVALLLALLQPCWPGARTCLAKPDVDPRQAEQLLEQEAELAAMQRARETASQLFYDVRLTFKDFHPSAVREIEQHFAYGWINALALQLAIDRRTVTLDAILTDPQQRLFVTADPDINLDSVASLELVMDSGESYPAQVVGLYTQQSAWLLQAAAPQLEVTMPPFAAGAVRNGQKVLLADVTRFSDSKDVRVRTLKLNSYLTHGDELEMFPLGDGDAEQLASDEWPVSNCLLFDTGGRVAAIVVWPVLVRMADRANYFVGWPTPAEALSTAELRQTVDRAVTQVERWTRGVKFRFRQEERRAGPSYYARGASGERVPEDEWITYGLAVGAELIFVPYELDREKVERIDRVVVLTDGAEVPAQFVGAFEEFGGMLVAPLEPLESVPDLYEPRRIDDLAIFVDVSVKHRFGAKDALPKYNRFFGTQKGYKDRVFRHPERPLLAGSFVLTPEGLFYGFATHEKRYESVAEQEALRFRSGYGSSTGYYRSGVGDGVRCFAFADVKDHFQNPQAHLDPRIRVKRTQERKELAWLGVEFQPITPELAKELDVEKDTRDGRYGLLVNLVYDDSPARRLGIQPGDLLLKVQEKGKVGEHLLRAGADGYYRGGLDSRRYASSVSAGMRFAGRGWFNRRNYLTGLLTSLGVGTEVILTYRHGNETRSAELTIEKAPPDLNSAEKYKNEATGLTVKDVTYEVRRILRLPEEFAGVIVYELEPGSAAAVGQITPMEFVEEINGSRVTDVAAFRAMLDELVAAGAESATFKVRNLDQSRFVEVQLEEPKEGRQALEQLIEGMPGMLAE